ncbi:MAG: BTAD domain-containing putative transcriptional regulator [Gammaproteobacteria bacterium]|jgi:DNA-binding SARP family transcriptional activator
MVKKKKNPFIAKLTAPRDKGWSKRERLFTLLDDIRQYKSIWISAPGGSGKTVLMASYLEARAFPHVWYQLDGGDADPAAFYHYLGSAVQLVTDSEAEPLPKLTLEYSESLPVFTRNFFRKVYARLRNPCFIVLDNYQDVAPDALLHQIIPLAIEELPEGINLVVLSRSDPPESYTRLRANSEFWQLDWPELRFTLQECEELVASRGFNNIKKEHVKALFEQSDGWVAGMVLLLEQMYVQDIQGEAPQDIHHCSRERIFDYFAGEVFAFTDAKLQKFLLRTAFLPKMTAAMAVRLSDERDANNMLAELVRKKYFIYPHGGDETIYEYHPLFREFLLNRSQREYTTAELIRVRGEASQILIENGQIENAAGLLVDLEDWQSLSELVLHHANDMLAQGRTQTLMSWLESIPEKIYYRKPWLFYWLGYGRFATEPLEARNDFAKAFELFSELGDRTGCYLSWAAVIETYVFTWNDFTTIDPWIELFFSLYTSNTDFPNEEVAAHVSSAIFSALLWRQPQHKDLPKWAERVKYIALSNADKPICMVLGNPLVFYYLWSGNFASATIMIDALRDVRERLDSDPLIQLNWYVLEAMHAFFNARHEACLKAVNAGIELAKQSGVHILDPYLYAQGIYSGQTGGKHHVARQLLKKMSDHGSTRLMDKSLYHYLYASTAWYENKLQSAIQAGDIAIKFANQTGSALPIALCYAEQSISLFDDGRQQDAMESLARGREAGVGMKHIEFMCDLYQAWFLLKTDQLDQGLVFLRRSMANGAEQGYVNLPRWKDDIMSELCGVALEHDIEIEYVRGLITKRKLKPVSSGSCLANWPWAIEIYALGPFRILKDDQPLRFTRKAQNKPLELLKVLIAFGGLGVSKEKLMEAVWPDADGDMANKSFDTNLYRLRKLLGQEALLLQEGQLTLNPRNVWIDVWAFERQLSSLEQELSTPIPDAAQLHQGFQRLRNLYQGDFLQNESTTAWMLGLRERLKLRWLRISKRLVYALGHNGKCEQAIEVYQKMIEIDDLAEEYYRGLMGCYAARQCYAEAIAVYGKCKNMMQTVLNINPSPETERLYAAIKQGDKAQLEGTCTICHAKNYQYSTTR